MDGATKWKKHDSLQKQISAYEKLLQHCMNKFSKEKLYQMLKLVTQGIPPLKGPGTIRSLEITKISSIAELREIVDLFPNKNKTGRLEKEEETHLMKYFDTFFNDLEYLQEMKQYFDEKIYWCLYEYYYDPMEDKGNVHIAPEEELDVEVMDESDKLAYAVRKLYYINKFWDKIFTEGEFDVKYFDPDSFHELLQFANINDFEIILRLIPDIFVKSYKSVELAKLWWTQANILYPQLPLKRNTPKSFQKLAESLEEKIVQLDSDIDKEEELLMVHESDLKALEGRESRFSELSHSCEEIEIRKNELGRQYNEFLVQRKSFSEEIDYLKEGTTKHRRISSALDKLSIQIPTTAEQLKLLSYNYDILQEDFQIELEVRPTVIRYVEGLREKVMALEESIRGKLTSKRVAEKQLELLRTNTQRMREIMRKHIQDTTYRGNLNENRILSPAKDKTDSWDLESDKDINGNISGEDHKNRTKDDSSKPTVHYVENPQLHAYSADDETDKEIDETRRGGKDGYPKNSVSSDNQESRGDIKTKHGDYHSNVKDSSDSTHESRKPDAKKGESKRNREPDKNKRTEIPIYNSKNTKKSQLSKDSKNVQSSKDQKKGKASKKENKTRVESNLTPRDERTNHPLRNKDPALIQLKPETNRTSPDSGLGTDKSSPQRTTDQRNTDSKKPKRASRLPQPALRPIPT